MAPPFLVLFIMDIGILKGLALSYLIIAILLILLSIRCKLAVFKPESNVEAGESNSISKINYSPQYSSSHVTKIFMSLLLLLVALTLVSAFIATIVVM